MGKLTASEARVIVDKQCDVDINPYLEMIYDRIERVAKNKGYFISLSDLFYNLILTEDMKTKIMNTLTEDGYVLKDMVDYDYGNREYTIKILSWEY